MNEEEVRKIVQDEMKKMALIGSFNIPYHTHGGIDSPQLDLKTALLGFPILPFGPSLGNYPGAPNGTIVLSQAGGNNKIHALINGTWYWVYINNV